MKRARFLFSKRDCLGRGASGVVRRRSGPALIALSLLLAVSLGAEATTTINHQFTQATINPGDTSVYRITVANASTVALTAAAVTVVLPSPVKIASPAGISNTCGFTVNAATPATSTVYLAAGTIPAGTGSIDGQCYFELKVTSTTPGNHIATIPAKTTPDGVTSGYTALENGTQVWNTTDANATLGINALTAPTGSKTFTPSPAKAGDPATLAITLSNPNPAATIPLTTFTDTLPDRMVVASSTAATTSCTGTDSVNGTVTAVPGSSTVTLTGGTMGLSGGCTISVPVVVGTITTTPETFTNSVAADAIGNTRGLGSLVFSKAVNVATPIDVTKTFLPLNISGGQPSLATIVVKNNSTANVLDITSFTDNLAGTTLRILGTSSSPTAAPQDPSVTCTGSGGAGGTLTAPLDLLGQAITLADAKAGPGGACTITAYLTSNVDGAHVNSIPANAVGNPNNYPSPAATATLNSFAQLTVDKSVTPNSGGPALQGSAAPGQWVKFVLSVKNWSGATVSGVNLKDVLPRNGTNQMTLFDAGSGFYTAPSPGCSGGTWTGTDAAGTSTGNPPTASDAGLLWTDGTLVGGTPGVCTVTIWAKLPSTATKGMTFTNTIGYCTVTGTGPAGPICNSYDSSIITVTVDAVAVTKAFSPTSIPQGGLSTATIKLFNRTVNALTSVSLTDTLPTGLTVAANPAATNGCGGSLQAFPGTGSAVLTGATVAARPDAGVESSCTITFRVTGTAVGKVTNTIPANDPTRFSNAEGVVLATAASADLTINTGLTGAKTFTPASVASGGVSRVKITLTNSSSGALTNVSVDDNTFSSGLTVANPADAATSCAGSPTMVVNPGAARAQMLGATLAAGGSCDFSFDAVTSGAGPWSNTVPVGKITAAEGLSNTAAVTADLTVAPAQININKSFNPVLVTGGVPSTLQIDVINPSSIAMTGVGFTDTFPLGIQVYSVPNATTDCAGGTITAIPGDGRVMLEGATVAAGQTCHLYVTTTSVKFLNLTNTIPANSIVSDQGYTNPSGASASLSTLQGLGVMKAFSPAYVAPDQVSTLKMRLISTLDPNAPTPITLTLVTYTDTLPAGVLIATTPNATTDCAGSGPDGHAVITPSNNGTTNGVVTVSQGTIPPNTNCSITVDVVASALGAYNNSIPENSVTSYQGIPNANGAQATLYVVKKPTIGKAFANAVRKPGEANTLTVTVNNAAAVALTGVSLTDKLPDGLSIASTPAAGGTCANGTVSADAGGGTLSLTGATIPAGTSCTFYADVVGNAAGVYINNINASMIRCDQGLTNPGSADATMTVLNAPTVAKAFNPVAIDGSGVSTLTITLGNPNASAITLSADFVDALPGNVFVAQTPTIGGTCTAGSVTAVGEGSSVTYASGAAIPSGGCTISVPVTSAVAGTYLNNIAASQLSTSAGVNQDPASASLGVGGVLVPPTMSKGFNPATIAADAVSRLTITLGNPNTAALTLNGMLTDTLPTNVVVAGTPNVGGTCPGTVGATAGSGSVTYADGSTIPSGGCTIQVDVTSGLSGSYTNTISKTALVTNGGSPSQAAVAGLVVTTLTPPNVLKSFDPSTINPGGTSALTINLGNSNIGAISLSSLFTDTLPTNVVVAAVPNKGGSCTVGSVTAVAGSSTITYAKDAAIPAGGCTITVDVTSSTSGGPWTNTIDAGGLVTNAGSNGAPATARLFVNPPQPPSISKSFNPTEIAVGGTSTLTISLGNGNLSGTSLTADLVDTLPTDVVVATNPNKRVSTGCTLGSIVASPGGTSVTYQSGGALPAGGCSVSVDLTSSVGKLYRNSIATGALVTGIGENAVGTEATLKVKAPPTIAKGFSPLTMLQGTSSTLTLTLGNPNANFTIATTASLVDNLPTNMTVAATPNIGGTCTATVTAVPGASTITVASGTSIPVGACTVTVDVTATVIGTYTNIIAASALVTDAGVNAASASADLLVYRRPTIGKSFSPTAIAVGETSTLTVALGNGNAGGTVLTADLVDTLPANVVIAGTPNPQVSTGCTLAKVSALAGGSSVTYQSGGALPAGGCTFSIGVTSTVGAIHTNTIVAGALQTLYGSNLALASADLKVMAPPTVGKSFSPTSVLQNVDSTLTLSLGNPNANYPITLSSPLTDTLPTNLVVSPTPAIGGTCTTSSVTAAAGAGTITYASGAAIPAGGCTITVHVRSGTLGKYTNTIDPGGLATDVGSNAAAATADLWIYKPPAVAKAFVPTEIVVNGTSRLTITLGNDNPFDLTLSSLLTDTLPAGVTLAGTPNMVTSCPGTVALTSGTIKYPSGAAIPATNGCTIAVDVTSAAGKLYTNAIAAGDLKTNFGNNLVAASANLKVKTPPTVTKSFNATQVLQNVNSTLTLTLGNPNTNYSITLSSDFTDTLPTNLVVGPSPTIGGTCTGTVTAAGGTGTITYASGATIPAGGCTITVPVRSGTLGKYTNTIAAGALVTDVGTNAGPVTADLWVYKEPTVGKAFLPTEIVVNGTSTLTLTLGNENPYALTLSAALVDTMPSGLVVASPSTVGGTCTGGVTATAGTRIITYANGATIPGTTGCTITVVVTSATGAMYTNAIAVGDLKTNFGNNLVAASANLKVKTPPTVAKLFNPTQVWENVKSTLTLTLGNPNTNYSIGLSSALVDTLPSPVVVAPTPNLGGTCNTASVTATAGTSTITYAKDATIPSGTCTILVDVVSPTGGVYQNSIPIGGLVTDAGSNAAAASDTLTVLLPPTVSKSFSPASVLVNSSSALTISLGNGNVSAVTLKAILTDALPSPVVVAQTPNLGGTCTAGSITATAGASSVTYAKGAAIPATTGCTIIVDVVSAASGSYDNTIAKDSLQTSAGNNPATATANLLVFTRPTVSKAFSPTTILENAQSTLTITLGNSNARPLTLASALVDGLPSGLVVAPSPTIGGTCTGTVTAVAGTGSITYAAGSTIQATTGCTITVPVTSATGIPYTNTIAAGALNTVEGSSNVSPAPAQLTVLAPPTVAKSFSPSSIFAGGTSTLTITLGNSNAPDAKLSSPLLDTFGAGYAIDSTLVLGGTCASANVTASAGGTSVTYKSGAVIPTGGCTITVRVAASATGTLTNSIPAGALSTDAGSNASAATAVLNVSDFVKNVVGHSEASTALPSVAIGETVQYELKFRVPNGSTLPGVQLSDTLPAELAVVSLDSLTADPGITATAQGGSLAAILAAARSGIVSPGSSFAVTFGDITNTNATPSTAESVTLRFTAVVLNVAANARGASRVNGATFTWTGTTNSASSSAITVVEPTLEITKTAAPKSAAAGDLVTFTFVVSHASASDEDAFNLSFSDTVPAGLVYVSGSLKNVSGPVATLDDSAAPALRATWASLPRAGGASTFLFQARVSPSVTAGQVIQNSVAGTWMSLPGTVAEPISQHNASSTVRKGSGTPSFNNYSVSANASVTAGPRADVSVVKTDAPDPAAVGGTLTYTFVVGNAGPSAAASVVFTDPLPPELTATAITPPSGWVCGTLPTGPGGTVTCTATSLAAGASGTMVLTATVGAATPPGTQLYNTAAVTSSTPDSNPANNASTAATLVARATEADLSVTKVATPLTAAAGRAIAWTIVARNDGPAAATGATVTDTFSSEVTGISWTCSAAGGGACPPSGTGNLSAAVDLPVGGTATFTVTGTIGGSATGPITNTVAIAAPSGLVDPRLSNNSASVSTPLGTSQGSWADLAVTKTGGPNPVTPGAPLVYTLTAVNNGPDAAVSVTLSDPLPATAYFQTVSAPAGWSCTAPAVGATGTVSCTASGLAVGATASFQVGVIVSASAAAGSTVANTATVSATTPDPVPENNTSTWTATVRASADADLSVVKIASPEPVYAGHDVGYTIVVRNLGPGTSTGITVIDTLPAGVTFISSGASQGTCGGTGPISCSLGDLVSGATATVAIVIRTSVPGSLSNTATAISTTNDPDLSNNTATATTTVVAPALAVTKSHADPFQRGTSNTYTILVANQSSATASPFGTVTVVDQFPVGIVPTAAAGTGWVCTVDGTARTARCTRSDALAPEAAWPAMTATVNVTESAASSSLNVVDVTGGGDLGGPKTHYEDPTTVYSASGLSILKTDGATTVVPGTSTTYTITVRNNGPSIATLATVTDPFPAAITSVSWTCATTVAGASCETASGTGNVSTRVTLPAGSTATITAVAQVSPAATGTLVNTATVTPPSDYFDPTPKSATDTDTLRPLADLAIVKTVDVPQPAINANVVFTLVASNLGPSTAVAATVADRLPPGLTWVSDDSVGSYDPVSGVWTLGTMTPSSTRTLHITAKMTWIATVTNTAVISSPTEDPVLTNNSSSVPVSVPSGPSADLSVVKTDAPDPVAPGGVLTYSFVVGNAGPSAAANAVFTDPLPPEVKAASINAPSGWTCAALPAGPGGTVTCTAASLAAGATGTIVLTASVAATTPPGTPLLNTAAVTSSTPDPDSANNVSTQPTLVARATEADLSVTKRANPTVSAAGRAITWTIVARNDGPAAATGATVTDTFPAGISGITWTCGAAGGAACPASGSGSLSANIDLPVGGTATFTVTGSIGASVTGPIANSVAITPPAGLVDPRLSNNAASRPTPLGTSSGTWADLALTKSGGTNPVTPGMPLLYTLTAVNNGPDPAVSVTVSDPLPASALFQAVLAPSGWSCTTPAVGTSGTVSCSASSLPAGATALFQVGVIVSSSASAGSTVVNTATVSATTPDPVPANNASSWTATVRSPSDADLSVVKIASPDPVYTGHDVGYTVVVRNLGPGTATGISLSDTLPTDVTLVSSGASQGSCSVTSPVTCSLGDLVPGATATVSVVVTTSAPGTLQNTASVSSTSTDPDLTNNTASAGPTVVAPSLAVTKSHVDPFQRGTSNSYTILVTNLATATAPTSGTVTVVDAFPVGIVPASASGTGWTCAVDGTARTATCSRSDALAPGAAWPAITAAVNVTEAAQASSLNVVDVAGGGSLVGPRSHYEDPTTVFSASGLSISKTDGTATVVPGTSTTYTITVLNGGPSIATLAAVTDPFPAAITSVAWTCAATGAGASCETASGTGNVNARVTLPAGTNAVFTAVAQVSPSATGNLVNTATVTPPAGSSDPTPRSATDTDLLRPLADLAIVKTVDVPQPAVNANVVFTLVASNLGPSTATAATVADRLPPGLTWVSDDSTGTYDPAAGLWTLGTMAPSSTRTLHVTARMTGTATVTNAAVISSATEDPVLTNNSSSARVTPLAADLSISKTASASQVTQGNPVEFTLIVGNAGPAVATGVTVQDALPAALTFLSAESSQGTCSGKAALSCSIGTMPVGGHVTIKILAAAGGSVTLTNTATISGDQPDPDLSNNTSSVIVTPSDITIPTLSGIGLGALTLALALAAVALIRRWGP